MFLFFLFFFFFFSPRNNPQPVIRDPGMKHMKIILYSICWKILKNERLSALNELVDTVFGTCYNLVIFLFVFVLFVYYFLLSGSVKSEVADALSSTPSCVTRPAPSTPSNNHSTGCFPLRGTAGWITLPPGNWVEISGPQPFVGLPPLTCVKENSHLWKKIQLFLGDN